MTYFRIYHRLLWRLGGRWNVVGQKPTSELNGLDDDLLNDVRRLVAGRRWWAADIWTVR